MPEFDCLIGKTITSAKVMKHKKYDDKGYLRLGFSDGSVELIVASYGGYTGDSADEYPTYIFLGNPKFLEKLA